MAKRMSKEQREVVEKAALRRRVLDIAAGARGDYSSSDFESEDFTGFASELGVESFAHFIGGIKSALLTEGGSDWLVSLNCMHRFDTLADAVDYLWEHGVRA